MPHSDETLASLVINTPVSGVTPGASPYTYTAPNDGNIIVQGGTVTVIELGRNGTFATTGLTAGVVPMKRGDQLRVTYAVAPTMTFFKG